LAYWLLKTEPGTYSWDDLVREKQTTWDGVTNATALIHIRAMKKNDLALLYHTGDEKAVVGVAQVASNPYPDPKAGDAKLVVFDLKPKRKLKSPVSLSTIKADRAFAGWDLLRIGRLSIVPVPETMWARIEALSEGSGASAKRKSGGAAR